MKSLEESFLERISVLERNLFYLGLNEMSKKEQLVSKTWAFSIAGKQDLIVTWSKRKAEFSRLKIFSELDWIS